MVFRHRHSLSHYPVVLRYHTSSSPGSIVPEPVHPSRYHGSTTMEPLTKYETIENNPARLHVYDDSSIGCMELHDLQVEEYAGTNRGNHNSSNVSRGFKNHRDRVKGMLNASSRWPRAHHSPCTRNPSQLSHREASGKEIYRGSGTSKWLVRLYLNNSLLLD